MTGELISIIVPIYNVEQYLTRCLDSICNQTYQNLEIILIDDGSPDRCPEICDKYAENDIRIVVIHQENRGLSAARNRGLDIARGTCIAFIDSDDYIHPDMIRLLYKSKTDQNACIAACHYEKVYGMHPVIRTTLPALNTFVYEKQGILYDFFSFNGTLAGIVCNKLYDRSLFDHIRFPENVRHEDEYVSHKLLLRAHRLVYIHENLYYYFQRESSMMNAYHPAYFTHKCHMFMLRSRDFKKAGYDDLAYHTRLKLLSEQCRYFRKMLAASEYLFRFFRILIANLFFLLVDLRPKTIRYLKKYANRKRNKEYLMF